MKALKDMQLLGTDDVLNLKKFARVMLAYGENMGCDNSGELFQFKHLEREYNVQGYNYIYNIWTNEWHVQLTMLLPFEGRRNLIDLYGNYISEDYEPEYLPFYEKVRRKLMICRNGQMEADHIIFSFWILTFGKDTTSYFQGHKETFERDMLALKMDDNYADLCEKLVKL
jgi:hypothetical protein